MSLRWTDAADRLRLITIIDGGLTSIKWHDIATVMQSKGFGVSHSACSQRYHKLRKEASNTTSTARKATTAIKGKPTKTSRPVAGSKRKAALNEEEDNNSDDSEVWDTPTKKTKIEIITVKEEEEDERQQRNSFKVEERDQAGRLIVDLENDDLYDDGV